MAYSVRHALGVEKSCFRAIPGLRINAGRMADRSQITLFVKFRFFSTGGGFFQPPPNFSRECFFLPVNAHGAMRTSQWCRMAWEQFADIHRHVGFPFTSGKSISAQKKGCRRQRKDNRCLFCDNSCSIIMRMKAGNGTSARETGI